MATAKKAKAAAPKKTSKAVNGKAPKATKPAAKAAAKPAAGAMKPVKETLKKTALVAHVAQASGVDPKSVKAVMAALEATVLASVNRKGAGMSRAT